MKYLTYTVLLIAVITLSFTNITGVITGKITDDKGVGIVGATITIKGTKTAVVTDADGKYSITVTKENAVLVFSSVGFKTKEVKVQSSNVINVALVAETSSLNEIVVIGYAAKKLNDLETSDEDLSIGRATTAWGVNTMSKPLDYNLKSNYVNGIPGHFDSIANNFNTEGYDQIIENPYQKVEDQPLSTFSIDVDAASYSNVRRFINNGQLPPAGAVRIEELINYFSYQYPQPTGNSPFSVNTEMAACPWNSRHKLALIGLQGKIIPAETLPASNLVFLIDVSGSMMEPDKLPLVKASLKLLTDQLRPQDKVSLVAYAGNAGLVLPSTTGDKKKIIKAAIDQLEAGGSTAGGAGIQLAYNVAKEQFVKDGNNRVILCTDGDFNVGVSSDDALETLIEKERESGVFLTELGYGTGNYQDAKMQKLADKGNGNHAYIDGIGEAKKVLINEFGGTLFTIAKDVKLQVEFNPLKVRGYRLIGYENRMLAKEDFNNDKKDAGELGSGHTVTALYEIIPAGINDEALDSVDALRYQKPVKQKATAEYTGECMNIKLRYKAPDGDKSILLEHPVLDEKLGINQTSNNFRFAAAVAEFGLLLRQSKYAGDGDLEQVQELAENAQGTDKEGYRREFLSLVESAALLKGDAKAKKVRIPPVGTY